MKDIRYYFDSPALQSMTRQYGERLQGLTTKDLAALTTAIIQAAYLSQVTDEYTISRAMEDTAIPDDANLPNWAWALDAEIGSPNQAYALAHGLTALLQERTHPSYQAA